MRRRTFLASTLVLATATLIEGCDTSVSPVTQPKQFDRRLAIPPLARSSVDSDGTRVFRLVAQEGRTELLPGLTTTTWGFNGSYLGPTLRARRGERVAIEVTNGLAEPTTVHWHGMHLPARMDGGPHQPVAPGSTWRPTWTIDQPAATLWYHPHPHGQTEKHVYRGLGGLFLLDDPSAEVEGLPSNYGVDDVPVIVQDKKFHRDGRLDDEDDGNEVGLLGSTVVVNGTYAPYHEVTTERVRLRLLNASTARTYAFGFDDDRSFLLVGTDGGLLAAPYETKRIRLSPGERAEIVVTMEPQSVVHLRSYEPDLGSVAAPFAFGGNDSFDVLELRAARVLAPSPPVPGVLARLPEPDVPPGGRVTRRFVLQDRQINGKRMDMERIDEVVPVGVPEVWEVRNDDLVPHNFHVHDVQFRVLTIDDQPPPPELAGRKDTIYLEPRRDYRIALKFEDYVDADFPLMYHCHLLLHEDEGLMGQFVVVSGDSTTRAVDPNDVARRRRGDGRGHHHGASGE
ncbi:multicopper oxidase family protein [Thermasporomyces composti]|uniref:FtsP/CotA-like multicopper oxidase with cupredoxin domain n=1 Tax=Thermasporomyces composti TaxID=696763 RepID=A0A3D9V7G0_THECX|nr:multicopper oxidase domain-containing protein [Thermasporomyces composti]REF36633.1 FtsP/CotA-like multicopper oxidase with cupredoxin domain [Thermasporomyces composti]